MSPSQAPQPISDSLALNLNLYQILHLASAFYCLLLWGYLISLSLCW